jgi:hypothetical protein
MATAAQLVKAIGQEILIRAVEAPLEADESQDIVFAMNNYMTAQAANGINLGYTVVTDLGDEITVPAGAIQGMIANVAIMVAPQFGAEVSQGLIVQAKIGLQAMRQLGVTIGKMQFPGTLPIGSGNEPTDNGFNNDHFFENSDDNILTETNQNIGLESGT